MGGLFFLPMGKGNKMASGVLADSLFTLEDDKMLLGAVIAAVVVLLASIFFFKNRKLQKLVVTGGLFFIGVFMGMLAMFYFSNHEMLGNNAFSFSAGIALPIVALILATLGNRGIKNDEKLVKSMDRLR
jgi:glucan phosphoethanolaminetransferase (alkaline phosphatase superfamily)